MIHLAETYVVTSKFEHLKIFKKHPHLLKSELTCKEVLTSSCVTQLSHFSRIFQVRLGQML